EFIGYATSAATAQMRFEDVEHAEQVGRVFARFRRFPEKALLRRIGADNLGKLVSVDGIVVRATQVRPTIVSAVFRCLQCLEIIREEQKTARFTRGQHRLRANFAKRKIRFNSLRKNPNSRIRKRSEYKKD